MRRDGRALLGGAEQRVVLLAHDLLAVVAVQLLGGVVPVHDPAQGVHDDDRGQDGVEQQGVVALRDHQARFQVAQVGDVLQLAGVAGDHPAGVPDDPGGVQDPLHGLLPAVQVRLQVVDRVGLQQAQELVLQLLPVDVQLGDVVDGLLRRAFHQAEEGRVGGQDVAPEIGAEHGVADLAEQLLEALAVAGGQAAVLAQAHQGVGAALALHVEGHGPQALRLGLGARQEDRLFGPAGLAQVQVGDELSSAQDVPAPPAGQPQEDFIEKDDFAAVVEDEEAVGELLEDLQDHF